MNIYIYFIKLSFITCFVPNSWIFSAFVLAAVEQEAVTVTGVDKGGENRRQREGEAGEGVRTGPGWPGSVPLGAFINMAPPLSYGSLFTSIFTCHSCLDVAAEWQQTLSQLSIFSFLSLHFFSFLVLATKKFFLFKILKIQLSSFLLHQSCTAPATPGLNTAWSPGSPCTGPRDRAAATTWRLFSSFPPWSSLWSLSVWCFSSSTDSQRSLQRNGGWRSVIFSFNS